MDYYLKSREILRGEMKRRGITISELARRLGEIGKEEKVRSLTVKISRGRFRMAFFMECMTAMGVEQSQIEWPTRAELRASASAKRLVGGRKNGEGKANSS